MSPRARLKGLMAPWRRRGPCLALASAVLMLHLWLLWTLAAPPPTQLGPMTSSTPRPLPIQLLPRQAALAELKVAAQSVVEIKRIRRPTGVVIAPGAPPDAPPAALPAALPFAPEPAVPVQMQTPLDAAAQSADVPVYATVIPPPASLHFALQRGSLTGSAELHWQRRGADYELVLEGLLGGVPVLALTSRGGIDADGVAPQRHAERKRAREVRAANFQRDAGLISFSGPTVQLPLRPGAQDRLSWLIQLPAIFEADPALGMAGAQVTLFVVGSRGDAQAWRFEVLGREALDLPAGPAADTVRLLREPSRPFDTRAEVWLDPARGHLPVRAVFTTVPGGQPLELQLSQADAAAP